MSDPRVEAERAEARDPHTPPERLAALSASHLSDVLDNPALELIATAEPDFWSRLPRHIREALCSLGRAPLSFVEWALRQGPQPTYAVHLVRNRALPATLRRRAFLLRPLPSEEWETTRPFLADLLTPTELSLLDRSAEPLTPAEVDALAALGAEGRRRAVRHPACSEALLEHLWDETQPDLQYAVLSHPNLSRARLSEALASSDRMVRLTAVRNPSLSAAQFAAAVEDRGTRGYVALNNALPLPWLEHLARDPEEGLRMLIAQHPALPAPLQVMLAHDVQEGVRLALIDRDALAPDAELVLASDPSERVRGRLGVRPGLSPEAEAKLDAQR